MVRDLVQLPGKRRILRSAKISETAAQRIAKERKRGLFIVLMICLAAMVGDALAVSSDLVLDGLDPQVERTTPIPLSDGVR